MPIKIKSSSVWQPVGDGNLRIRSGGAWQVAQFIKIKSGGAWVDTGYRGYPSAPTSFGIPSWDFSTVNVSWAAPAAGGAPVSNYHVIKTNNTGNASAPSAALEQYTVGVGTLSQGFSVSQDTQYQFYVRSKSAAGLFSAWVGPLKAQIGHPEVGHYEDVTHTRDWTSAVGFQNGICRDETATVYVPQAVLIYSIHIICSPTVSAGYVSGAVGPNNRQVYAVGRGGQLGLYTGAPWNTPSVDTYVPVANEAGGNAGWGVVTRGVGWSARPATTMMLAGAIYVFGTEYYPVSTWFVTTAYVANTTW